MQQKLKVCQRGEKKIKALLPDEFSSGRFFENGVSEEVSERESAAVCGGIKARIIGDSAVRDLVPQEATYRM